jgi:hypothetical protein
MSAQTCTNSAATPALTLDQLLDSMTAAMDVAPVLRQYRIHPSDYAELKRSVPSLCASTPMTYGTVFGLDLVLDQDAERMPRRHDVHSVSD